MAERSGVVVAASTRDIVVDTAPPGAAMPELKTYGLKVEEPIDPGKLAEGVFVWPTFRSWQVAEVKPGQTVKRKEILARGVTHVYFQANVWVFTGLVFLAGIMMGIGKAAVYKHIPEYFPHDVGVVGGLVGVIGGLGGFFCPILFGYLLKLTGLWTSCWLFLALLSVVCLVWMHLVILRMTRGQASNR